MDAPEDAALLRSYADKREHGAFAAIVRRYIDLVYSVALRCAAGDRHLAEDVAQEVFVLVARRAGALSRHQALEGWLYTTTRCQAIHAVRREHRRRERERKAKVMNEPLCGNEPECDWEKLRPMLDEAAGRLSVRDRLWLPPSLPRRWAQPRPDSPALRSKARWPLGRWAGPWLQFMATSKTITAAGGIVLLAAAALTLHEFQLARQGRPRFRRQTRRWPKRSSGCNTRRRQRSPRKNWSAKSIAPPE